MAGWKSKFYPDQSTEKMKDDSNLLLGNQLNEILKRFDRLEQRIEALEEHLYEREKIEMTESPNEKKRKARAKMWKDQLANNTTIHGLKPVLTERNRILRPSWILIFVAAVACTGYYISKVVNEYQTNPTATKVRIIRQDAYDYPIMLLCPDTWLDADKAFSLNISEAGLQYALGFLINYGLHKSPYKIKNFQKSKQEFESWWFDGLNRTTRFHDLADFFKYIALDSDAFKLNCSYCDAVEGSVPLAKIIMNEGVCYNLSLTPIDGRFSLSDLDYLHVKLPPNKSKNYLPRRSAWRLIVNPDLNLGLSDTHYSRVFPNQTNTIRVTPYHFTSLPNSEKCISSDQNPNKNYSQSECVAGCFLDQIRTCHPFPLIRYDSIPENISKICNTAELAAQKLESEAMKTDMETVDTPFNCIEQCLPLCEKWVYENSIESTQTQSQDEDDVGVTKFYFLNQVVHYGGILSHEEVATYSFETLVSNVGGQAGLWLGASIVSVIDLCLFFTHVSFTSLSLFVRGLRST